MVFQLERSSEAWRTRRRLSSKSKPSKNPSRETHPFDEIVAAPKVGTGSWALTFAAKATKKTSSQSCKRMEVFWSTVKNPMCSGIKILANETKEVTFWDKDGGTCLLKQVEKKGKVSA